MEKYYSFAGVETVVSIPDAWMYEDDRHLAPFRVNKVTDPHRFHFEYVDTLAPPVGDPVASLHGVLVYRDGDRYVRYIGSVDSGWENAYIRAAYGDKEHYVQVKTFGKLSRIAAKTVLNAMGAEHLVAENGGFVFHCSYIEYAGKAILFTAPSGTGKSTQAELWKIFRGADIVNGDRAAVCVKDGLLTAEGIPFSGSSSYCASRSLPIAAIVYLAQAPRTTIRILRGMEAFSRIWEGVSVNTWVQQDLERVADAVQRAASSVPVYCLACTPDESAVIALEDMLRKQELI